MAENAISRLILLPLIAAVCMQDADVSAKTRQQYDLKKSPVF